MDVFQGEKLNSYLVCFEAFPSAMNSMLLQLGFYWYVLVTTTRQSQKQWQYIGSQPVGT